MRFLFDDPHRLVLTHLIDVILACHIDWVAVEMFQLVYPELQVDPSTQCLSNVLIPNSILIKCSILKAAVKVPAHILCSTNLKRSSLPAIKSSLDCNTKR